MNAGNLFLLIIGIMFPAGCVSPGARPEEHSNMRKFFQKLKCGEEATVAYFGGSITWGATATDPLKTSWRALLAKRLQREFPASFPSTRRSAAKGPISAYSAWTATCSLFGRT